jgi:deazaflavin-dependent oxidoreductase (nitroreductase family)
MKNEKIYNSPTPWVSKHVKEYLETGGKKGHKWNGAQVLLLTTRGRESRKLRRTALIYGEDKGNYIVVASRGGHPEHPNWYLNLSEEPKVRVQVGTEEFEAMAKTATGAQRTRLWALMTEIWPEYESYQKRTERTIPIVVLSPTK